MSQIEQDIIKVTSFEPPRKYEDRQDYLAALVRAVDKLDDVEFDLLGPVTVEWVNDAASAMRNRKKIVDFPDNEDTDDNLDTNEADTADAVEQEADAGGVQDEPVEAPVKVPARRKKGAAPRKLEHPKVDPKASIENFQTDKYGIVVGSKNAAAAAMFEKGCRMSDVTASIGGTYYNLVARLKKQGHTVESGANGFTKLTHKDAA